VVGPERHVTDHSDDLVIIPGAGKLRLSWYVGFPPVPAASAVAITVENVHSAARGDLAQSGHVAAELGE
jgi:hypothetical protein